MSNFSLSQTLTENKQARIQFCLEHLDLERSIHVPMLDEVHVDEKWFNMKELTKSYYLVKGEPEPH